MTARTRVVVGTVVAGLLLTAMVVASLTRDRDREPAAVGRPSGTAATAGATPDGTPTWAGPTPPPNDTALMLGRQTAPVVIVEFGDFQCPKCALFARSIKPELVRKYVDAGVARIYWRDFPAFGKESERAAIAARAAARQGRFWQYHDLLYERQPPLRSGRITDGFLRGLARDAGLDVARFDADRRDRALRAAVADDFAFGQQLGVPGTPAFLINGRPFFGAQPLGAFEEAIAAARAGR